MSLYINSNVNVLRNDNNVARVKSKRIETSICSIINIKLSKPIFGLPMEIFVLMVIAATIQVIVDDVKLSAFVLSLMSCIQL